MKVNLTNIKDFIPPILTRFLKTIFSAPQHEKIVLPYFHTCLRTYSQYNEDIIINLVFSNKSKKGFYVDVGANDPVLLNNTRRLYENGWTGINIEPNYNLFNKLQVNRKKDINLNIGVGCNEKEITFYECSIDTISSFDKKTIDENIKKYGGEILSEKKIPVVTLSKIFEKYTAGNSIDFLSIDVEGLDVEVLQSNNWKLYRPSLIMIEYGDDWLAIDGFLKQNSYTLVYRNYVNALFFDNEQMESIKGVPQLSENP
jgi:FkbM family methyltransferase